MGHMLVDMDGTLAHFNIDEYAIDKVGEPIAPMVDRVKQWLAAGIEVKIFTARASDKQSLGLCRPAIEAWCEQHIGRKLPITAIKDYGCIQLWDDRAMRVVHNTGRLCCERPVAPTDGCFFCGNASDNTLILMGERGAGICKSCVNSCVTALIDRVAGVQL